MAGSHTGMADATRAGREDPEHRPGVETLLPEVRVWFVREVLPLEADLMQFLHHNWRNKSDIADLRQDVYVRVLEHAQREIPERTRHFVFITARNLLIDRVRREHIVPFDAVADVDALGLAMDAPGPDRNAMARDELRKLHIALERLPSRSREAVVLKRIEGLTGREIAARMGISEAAVSKHIDNGICTLADILYGEPAEKRRRT
jgi:RNA polymerase sigma factor (sigma-70 family)